MLNTGFVFRVKVDSAVYHHRGQLGFLRACGMG